jgi:hypothetical protein
MAPPLSTRQLLLRLGTGSGPVSNITLPQLSPELRQLVEERFVNFGPGFSKDSVTQDGKQVERLLLDIPFLNSVYENHPGGTTPAAPQLQADDTADTLAMVVPAGEAGEQNFRLTGWVDYAGQLNIGDVYLEDEAYAFRLKANSQHGPGLSAFSPEFNKKAIAPDPSGPANLLAHSSTWQGWSLASNDKGSVTVIAGFDGTPGTGRRLKTTAGGADITSPYVTVSNPGSSSLTNSLFIKPGTLKRLRSYDVQQFAVLDYDFVNKVITNAQGAAVGHLVDVSSLGGNFVGAYRLDHTYPQTYPDNLLQYRRVDSDEDGEITFDIFGGMLNVGGTPGTYQAT